MNTQSNKSTGDKTKQNKGETGRMQGTNTTSNHSPCTHEDIHRDHEHRITILEGKTEQHDRDIKQQRKDMAELNEGLWNMLNSMNSKLTTLISGLSNIGIINGNQDKDIECLKEEVKERKKDKRQSRKSLRDIAIGSFLTFIFLIIASYIIPGVLKHFHL